MTRKKLSILPLTKIQKENGNAKNISTHVLKISAILLVLRTPEITDIFNTFDEIIFGIQLKKVNILHIVSYRCKVLTTTVPNHIRF